MGLNASLQPALSSPPPSRQHIVPGSAALPAVRPDEVVPTTSPDLTRGKEQPVPKADGSNFTAMPRVDGPDASDDIIDDLYAGVGILLHLAGSGSAIQRKEITFVAGKLLQSLNELRRALHEEKRRSAEPQS